MPHYLKPVPHSFSCRDWHFGAFFHKIDSLDLTAGNRYGYSCQRGRVTTAVNAVESIPVMHSILQENDAGLICRRRGKFQPRCDDFSCESCRFDVVNMMGLNKAYLLGILGQAFLLQLPLRDRHTLLTRGYGVIMWSDVDWDTFMIGQHGESRFCFRWLENSVIDSFDFQPSKLKLIVLHAIFHACFCVATLILVFLAVDNHGQPLRVMINLGRFFGKSGDGSPKSLRHTLEVSD